MSTEITNEMTTTAESRPWPVVLMTALGAWFAAVPLTIMIFLALGPVLRNGAGPYLIGVLLLAASVVVLRQRSLPLFVEQLAVPGLLAGGLCLGYVLFKDLPDALAAALLAVLALAVAAGIARPWLRILLGAMAAELALTALDAALSPSGAARWHGGRWSNWLGLHALLCLWALALAMQGRLRPSWAALIEPLAVGWLLSCLVDLSLMGDSNVLWGAEQAQKLPFMPVVSALLAAAGALWAARAWPGLRRPWQLAVAFVLIGSIGAIWILVWLAGAFVPP